MAGNTFGNLFRLTTFGESHGPAIGGIIDGCPAGLKIDLEALELDMNRRRPGQSSIVTQRKEQDKVKLLSGIFEGITTGTPIGFTIENTDQSAKDYSHDLSSKTPIKVQKIIHIWKTRIDLHMPIIPTKKSTV